METPIDLVVLRLNPYRKQLLIQVYTIIRKIACGQDRAIDDMTFCHYNVSKAVESTNPKRNLWLNNEVRGEQTIQSACYR
jgi:hypothetical protein